MTTVVAEELRFIEGTSNKFYRVYTFNSKGIVVLQWGKIGTVGQWGIKTGGVSFAVSQINSKHAKGYEHYARCQFDVPDNFDVAANHTGLDTRFRAAMKNQPQGSFSSGWGPPSDIADALAESQKKKEEKFKAFLLDTLGKTAPVRKPDQSAPIVGEAQAQPAPSTQSTMEARLAAALADSRKAKS